MTPQAEMKEFRTSDGLRLRYVIDDYADPWQEHDTLVMVHAAMGNSRRFYAWVPHLARKYHVVRLDQRGHGASDIPGPDQLSFERLVLDVKELLDHLDLPCAHLAGSSAGAIVCQGAAIKFPERVKTLASFAATPGMKIGKQDYSGWVRRIGASGVARFLRETIGDRIDLAQVEPGFVDWFIAEAARTSVDVLARFVPMMAAVDLVPELHKIRCPVLCVVPGGDPIHDVGEYRLFEKLIARCEFIVYEGLPHNITDAVPDRCAEDLRRFLDAQKD
jgi:3-oxoadipate enol-lactonase